MNAARMRATPRRSIVACLAVSLTAVALVGAAPAAASCWLVVFCTRTTTSAPPPPPPPLPKFFAPTSVWNKALPASATLTANSDALVATLKAAVQKYGATINTSKYSAPVYIVPAGTKTSRVRLRYPAPADLVAALQAVPLPSGAHPAAGSDGHLVVYQPSTDSMWEFWQLSWTSLGWVASWGGKMTSVMSSSGIFEDGYGATATGLPLVGGMMSVAELQAGSIDHALSFAMPYPAPPYVWPAQHGDGDGPATSVPEGTEFRLPATLNVDALNLPPVTAMIAKAVQRYGMILRSKGGSFAFYGQDPSTWTRIGLADPYPALYGTPYPSTLLASFPWSQLQAIQPLGSASATSQVTGTSVQSPYTAQQPSTIVTDQSGHDHSRSSSAARPGDPLVLGSRSQRRLRGLLLVLERLEYAAQQLGAALG
jgi:hypothetical protein